MKTLCSYLVVLWCCVPFPYRAVADERDGFYRFLVANEKQLLDAVRRRAAGDLLSIHNDAMDRFMGGKGWPTRGSPECVTAYLQLGVVAVLYSAAIEPERMMPQTKPDEVAALGDREWKAYLDRLAECEKSVRAGSSADRVLQPSRLLNQLLPPMRR
ncbi:hypothetical protein GGC47_004467 [Bosea sp. OAE752]|uniref:hypothetical protein n=1 Tax=Bosea sp. OAE752 TaxID=2663873 RepID=UPI003D1FD6A1